MSAKATDSRLTKSARRYLDMVKAAPNLGVPLNSDDRALAAYLRELYDEFGQKRVRAEIDRLDERQK